MLLAIDFTALHDEFGLLVLAAAGVGALIAVLTLFVPFLALVLRLYLRVLMVGVAVQAVLGAVIYATGHRPADALHYVYGAATLAAVPITLALSRKMPWPVSKFWLVGGAVVVALLAYRALSTG